jgi:integrase
MALTDTGIRLQKHDGSPAGRKYSDGGGLYLHVKAAGKYWRLAYRYLGKQKTLAFGVYPRVSLALARQKRDEAKQVLAAGKDPQEDKRAKKQAQMDAAANTFKAVTLEWHAMKAKSISASTSNKQLAQFERDIFPVLGARPIAEIKTPELLRVLSKASARAPYTAIRLREMCGQVFRLACATGRADTNPVSNLGGMLPTPVVKHRAALTTGTEFGKFVRDLDAYPHCYPLTKLAAKFALLTWTRSREMRLARWEHIDLQRKEWRVPAADMKMGKQLQAHTVPLSPQAAALLEQLRPLSEGTGRLFPGNHGADSVISENTINGLFKKMGYKGKQTHHGLRASARSLLSERDWSAAALERQLDHAERNKVVAAYARSEHLIERRKFMDDWGTLIEEFGRGPSSMSL